MKRTTDEIRNAIDTTLSGASHDPTLFSSVVNASKGDSPPMKRKLTLSMAFVLVLALLTGSAAMAAAYYGVTWFLTDRYPYPVATVDADRVMTDITQTSTSEWLDVAVQDAYWDGYTLSLTIRATAKDAATPFAMLYDIGVDGETFDMIWLSDAKNSNRMPVEDWLDGRTGILLRDPGLTFLSATETINHWASLDFIHVVEENAVILMLQLPVNDMSEGADITIQLNSAKLYPGDPEDAASDRLYHRTSGETEFAELVLELPAMEKPFPEHECEYTPATCQSPMVCSICGRYEGWPGEHDFQPSSIEGQEACTVCGLTREKQ